jgi:hypothetical protein
MNGGWHTGHRNMLFENEEKEVGALVAPKEEDDEQREI